MVRRARLGRGHDAEQRVRRVVDDYVTRKKLAQN
jgi:hypothetical protein